MDCIIFILFFLVFVDLCYFCKTKNIFPLFLISLALCFLLVVFLRRCDPQRENYADAFHSDNSSAKTKHDLRIVYVDVCKQCNTEPKKNNKKKSKRDISEVAFKNFQNVKQIEIDKNGVPITFHSYIVKNVTKDVVRKYRKEFAQDYGVEPIPRHFPFVISLSDSKKKRILLRNKIRRGNLEKMYHDLLQYHPLRKVFCTDLLRKYSPNKKTSAEELGVFEKNTSDIALND